MCRASPRSPVEPVRERPTRSEPAPRPLSPWPRPERPWEIDVVAGLSPLRRPKPNIVYFAGVDLVNSGHAFIEGEGEDFPEIQHTGAIVAIEAASFLPHETFEVLREWAEELRVDALPVYVRRLG